MKYSADLSLKCVLIRQINIYYTLFSGKFEKKIVGYGIYYLHFYTVWRDWKPDIEG